MFFKKAVFKSMFTDQSKANRITIGLKSLHADTRTFSNPHLDLAHIPGVKLKDQKRNRNAHTAPTLSFSEAMSILILHVGCKARIYGDILERSLNKSLENWLCG